MITLLVIGLLMYLFGDFLIVAALVVGNAVVRVFFKG